MLPANEKFLEKTKDGGKLALDWEKGKEGTTAKSNAKTQQKGKDQGKKR